MMWEAVRAGEVRWYRATEIMHEINAAGLCRDAAQWVDEQLTPQLNSLTRGRALRLTRGLIAAADPESARERELAAKNSRHVTITAATVNSGGCRDLYGTLDVTDAIALDATLSQLAQILAADGDERELDHRRATALGILADPSRAYQLLNGQDAPCQQKATLIVHLSPLATETELDVARVEGHGPLSRDTWVELLGDTRVTVRPVVDLNQLPAVDAYEIPDRVREAVCGRSPVDMFPYGTLLSRSCDLDHTIPYDHGRGAPPGQTRIDNLAPIHRKAHRAKTSGHWKVTQYEGGWLEWTSPAGYRYATGPYGTLREVRATAA